MSDWRLEIDDAIKAFLTVAELAGERITMSDLVIEYHPAPHKQPKHLPHGKMAVYAFWWNGEWLKIGKAGPKTNARYTSQHYTGSAPSTLAGSLVSDTRMAEVWGFDGDYLGEWKKKSTCRVNILISSEKTKALLSLLEVFLHARLRPLYEGNL